MQDSASAKREPSGLGEPSITTLSLCNFACESLVISEEGIHVLVREKVTSESSLAHI